MHTFNLTRRQLAVIMWLIGLTVMAIAVVVWHSQRVSGNQTLISYSLFPLFGLVAFSLMWTHYIGGALRRYLGFDKSVLSRYFRVTSVIVLVSLLLHPGILWLQLAKDGFGLPPLSHLAVYTDNAARFVLLLGTISLILFLAFELHRIYSEKSWWRYVIHGNTLAMFLIFFHAFVLGGELDVNWFRVVWLIYGVTLLIAVVYNQIYDKEKVKFKHEK